MILNRNLKNNNITFSAIPVAKYKTNVINQINDSVTKNQNLKIYELGKEDLVFITRIEELNERGLLYPFNKLKNPKTTEDNYKKIIGLGIKAIKKSLLIRRDNKNLKEPSKIYLASFENNRLGHQDLKEQACGFIIGNMPKIDMPTKSVMYSNRRNPEESELDYLLNFPSWDGKSANATAPALMSELMNSIFKLPNKFKSMFIRCEPPEKSKHAENFYKKIGFEVLKDKKDNKSEPRILAERPEIPELIFFDQYKSKNFMEDTRRRILREIVPFPDLPRKEPEYDFTLSDDKIVPMFINKNDAEEAIKSINKKFQRTEIKDNKQVDLNDIVEL